MTTRKTVDRKTVLMPAIAARQEGLLRGALDAQVAHYSISAPHDGYRRAGRAWTVAEQQVPLAELSFSQQAALLADSRLRVVPVPAEVVA